ncbi:MAG: hypothetical protein WBJ35_02055 [Acetomicrobium sp.]
MKRLDLTERPVAGYKNMHLYLLCLWALVLSYLWHQGPLFFIFGGGVDAKRAVVAYIGVCN